MLKLKKHIALGLLSIGIITPVNLAAPLAAAEAFLPVIPSQSIQDKVISHDNPLFIKARSLAALGGGARYCGEDKDVIAEFLVKAQNQLTKMAKDNYEQTFVRVEFKNLMTAFTVKKPEKKCAVIITELKSFLR